MKVKLLAQISGTRDGEGWPAPGTVIDLPDDEATSMINSGLCAAVVGAPTEAAAIEPAETATAPKARKR